MFVGRLGKSTLGLGYSLCGAELLLGPVVPSNTARGGGILSPIVLSLCNTLDSRPHREQERAGKFLVLVAAHANLITAAMFLTGMAANPVVARAAKDILGIEFGWRDWALGAIVPGLVSLTLLPPLMYFLSRPELKDTRAAQAKGTPGPAGNGAVEKGRASYGGRFCPPRSPVVDICIPRPAQYSGRLDRGLPLAIDANREVAGCGGQRSSLGHVHLAGRAANDGE